LEEEQQSALSQQVGFIPKNCRNSNDYGHWKSPFYSKRKKLSGQKYF
jgi:hypothetical protein